MAVSRRAPNFQPDPQQSEAIEHVHGPMLVVAGAGTGKTTVLTRRIARLISEGQARADEILALTYTINAAAEMRHRVERELRGLDTKALRVCTFHAYCNDLLVRSGRDFRVLDDPQLWIFLRRNIRELRLNYYVRAASVAEFLRDLTDFIRRCHDELVGPEQYAEYVRLVEAGELPLPRVAKSKKSAEISDEEALGRCREIAFVFASVERMLLENKLGTFGHQILGACKLFQEDPELLDRERRRTRFILVDEFQDANYAQIKVLEQIAGADQNILVVGDPDQGIYRFRGASSEAFQLFQKRFPSSKLIALTKNRRSTTPILKCAHEVIRHNPEPLDSEYARTPLVSARDEAETSPRSPVETVLVTGNFMEATDLVTAILDRRRTTRCEWNDIAVLYRIHSHRDELAAELARSGIPFSIEGLDILDAPEVRDVLACLGSVLSDADSTTMFRVAALAQFTVDPEELRTAIKSLPRDSAVPLAVVLPGVKGGAQVVEAVRHARGQTAGSKVYASLLTLVREFQVPRSSAVETLLRFANEWEKAPLTQTGEPGEFLEYLEYFREAKGTIPLPANEQNDAVKLMTAHSAKGLEFDHVFILRAITNSFPASFREPLIDFPAELRNSSTADYVDEKKDCEQEERRLFYVAMTRARDSLTMYGKFGRGKTDKTPAGYLRELIKNRDLKGDLKQRTCREFQTEIFAAAEPSSISRLSQWIALTPASDLSSTLSASAIQHYETCPLQFKLEREWRIPAEPSGALQYGACMHRVLLTYYDSVRWNRRLSKEELIERFCADIESAGFTDNYQRELYEKKGIEELRQFVVSAELAESEVLHTEERFKVKLGSTNLVGRIDRVDRGSGDGVVITDYKTGRPRSQEDADESLQLAIYALAARETWGYRVDRLVFHNLDGNTQIGTDNSEFKIEEAKVRVQSIAEKISAGQFEAKPGFHCAWCAFRVLCPKTEKKIPEFAKPAAAQN
jgi:DNA helicase II / ATP-dependent DNA helicase PcrA